MIKVSVVIAAYNAETYIRQCIDSLENQTLKEIEIIIVNDNSTDDTLKVISEYEKKDHRIKVVDNKIKSEGAGLPRNIGLKRSKGEYIMIVDSDDFFEPDMLKNAYNCAKENDSDTVIFDAFLYDHETKENSYCNFCLKNYTSNKSISLSPHNLKLNLFRLSAGMVWNKLFRREMIIKNNISFQEVYHADDIKFSCIALCCSNQITLLPQKLYHYRVNNKSSQCSNISKHPLSCVKAMKIIQSDLIDKNLYDEYKYAFMNLCMFYFIYYLRECCFHDLNSCSTLLTNLQTETFEELSIDLLDKENSLVDVLPDFVNFIKSTTPANFQKVSSFYEYPYPALLDKESFKKIECIEENKNICVYGSGYIGQYIFNRILTTKKNKNVYIVDKNYKNHGAFVLAPDILKELPIDLIIVTVQKKEYQLQIFDFLDKINCKCEKFTVNQNIKSIEFNNYM